MAKRSRLRRSVTINEASSAVKTMVGAGEVDVSVGIPHLASQVFRGGDHCSTGHRGSMRLCDCPELTIALIDTSMAPRTPPGAFENDCEEGDVLGCCE